MKRFLPASLAILLVMAGMGNVLAAAFCPRALGRNCCIKTTVAHTHTSPSTQPDMMEHDNHHSEMMMGSMDGMMMADMPSMQAQTVAALAEIDTIRDYVPVNELTDSSLTFSSQITSTRFELPDGLCAHCEGHSGTSNAPVSSVNVFSHRGKEIGSTPLPVAHLFASLEVAQGQIRLPGEHAPPGFKGPRHALLGILLI